MTTKTGVWMEVEERDDQTADLNDRIHPAKHWAMACKGRTRPGIVDGQVTATTTTQEPIGMPLLDF